MEIIHQWQVRKLPPTLLRRELLGKCREIGFTSLQSYVTWAEIERERNKWDFTIFDELVEKIVEADLKWVPFLILGPHYATPRWFLDSNESLCFRCLEHDKEVPIQSIWNPFLPKYVERFIRSFSEHYRDHSIFESILLGISGNWGEALYPATGGFSNLSHTHVGWWCGDKFAIRSFREWLKKKYGNIECLNKKWGSNFSTFEHVTYPRFLRNLFHWGLTRLLLVPKILKKMFRVSAWERNLFSPILLKWPLLKREESRNQWFDFIEWYITSMSDWAELWIKNARKFYPKTKIYLVVGGDGNPMLGADFVELAKRAAKYRAGIRITNQGDEYTSNFTLTRLTAVACKFYGVPFTTEEALLSKPGGVVARIFDTVTAGADGIYFKNILMTDVGIPVKRWNHGEFVPGNLQMFLAHVEFLKRKRMKFIKHVAVFYPKKSIWTDLSSLWLFGSRVRELRNFIDFDLVDEKLISEGILKNYRFLLVLDQSLKNEIASVLSWIEKGGVLVYLQESSSEKVVQVRGIGKGFVMSYLGKYDDFVEEIIFNLQGKYPWNGLPYIHGDDGVYWSWHERGFLCYNAATTEKSLKIGNRSYLLPPCSITEVRNH